MGDVLLPILKDTKDPHYRYKMPKLTAKVEGSGNGIKTVITNMGAVAKALDRPAAYPTKYFGCELGAQVTMNNDIYVVNGSHDADRLLSLLYGFIQKFVLCTKCKNPETSLIVDKQTIRQKCIACGHETTIPKTIHKLTTYIINHPPDGTSNPTNASSSTSAGSSKSGKSDKKSRKNNTHSPTNQNHNGGDNSSPNNDKNNNHQNDNNDDDFGDDFDEDEFTTTAYAERIRELLADNNNKMYLNDTKENANIFYEMVKQKKESTPNLLLDANTQKELVKEAERLDIKDKSTLILSELLFTENIVEEIKTYRLLLLRFCHENRKAQKYLLGGFEKLIGIVYEDKLFNNAMKILKQFYDMDILEEESILEWAAKPSKKYVDKEMSKRIHEKVAPFVKWLKEAEVEDESEDEEDEEEDEEEQPKKPDATNNTAGARKQSVEDEDEDDDDLFEFNHRVSGIKLETVKPAATITPVNATNTAGPQEEEDIDIDNI